LGGSLVVISPERPERTADMAAKQSLGFPILWDRNSAVAEAFGLAFSLPADLREVYLGFGIDLPAHNDDPSWRLPIPARFVIDGAGVVRFVQADPDYTRRPEPETTVEALRVLTSE
jgi:peroxiredoxin